jgi:hypothetical protein
MSDDLIMQFNQFRQTTKLKTNLRNKIKNKISNIAYIFTKNNEDNKLDT